ncbi:MAG: tRNA (N(6)-L-threonylcarbamoyladenosine(37)-C(2))-methylthiotransferase MtaB [Halanaerobium sp.]|nr:tRNA (N(6)-L-threonylcarbamoyladenosine(37)-C(2))-methylthiotransferase MtaB [Halanaerobium sp.]
MRTAAFYTLGCKVNQYDTEAMMEKFQEAGYQIVEFASEADVYIINSCTVTGQGAKKSRQMARKARSRNPAAVVGLAGCYPQTEPEKVLDLVEVDFIIGTQNRERIVHIAEEAAEATEPLNAVLDIWQDSNLPFEELSVHELHDRTRAAIKVQEGCNQFCSYCIIPYARGPLRSRKPGNVIKEIDTLLAAGVREFVLTGIHLGAYGIDMEEDYNLTNLVRDILAELPRESRLRLSSLEVTEVSEGLVEMMARENGLCRHLHLPLQSGAKKILRKMNRPYTPEYFLSKVNLLRERVPGIGITTDIMVGFPGEGEDDFKVTCQVAKEAGFSKLHVFRYSPRPGTPAYKMKPRVSGQVKRSRSERLRAIGIELERDYIKSFLDSRLEILVEDELNDGHLVGFSDNYIRVFITGDGRGQLKGKLVDVQLVDMRDDETAYGRVYGG